LSDIREVPSEQAAAQRGNHMSTEQPHVVTAKASTWYPIDPPRPLNDWERQVIDLLLSYPKAHVDTLPGSDAVRRQLVSARVNEACSCCLSVGLITDHDPANQILGSPTGFYTDANGQDTDGMTMWAILFTKGGYLSELEVQRADGSPFTHLPDPRLFLEP
jgi:hypothetical protein